MTIHKFARGIELSDLLYVAQQMSVQHRAVYMLFINVSVNNFDIIMPLSDLASDVYFVAFLIISPCNALIFITALYIIFILGLCL